MITKSIEVRAEVGLHLRPAGRLAELATKYAAEGINILVGKSADALVPATSALRLLALKVHRGEMLFVQVDTADVKTAETIFAAIDQAIAEN